MKRTGSLLLIAIIAQFALAQPVDILTAKENIVESKAFREALRAEHQGIFSRPAKKSGIIDPPEVEWDQFGANKGQPSSAVWSLDGSELYVSNFSIIYLSKDRGATWDEFYKVPESGYLGVNIRKMKFHPADPDHLYYTIGYAPVESQRGLYRLNIQTGISETIRSHSIVNDFEFLNPTGVDSLVVVTKEMDQSHYVWLTVDDGQYWKKVSEMDGIEQAEVIFREDGGLELLIAGTGGVFSVDFNDAWASQIWDWKHEFKTVERGDTVPFTRSIGIFETLPGEDRLLAGFQFFSNDRYDDDSIKRAKFWELDFAERFAREYEDIVWDDDTTLGGDRRFGATDIPFSVEFDPNNPDRVWLGEGNEILFSNDGAKTWSSMSFEYRDMWVASQILCNPVDSNHLYVIGDQNAIITEDNFESFGDFGISGLVLQDLDVHVGEQGELTVYYTDWYNRIFSENGTGSLLGESQIEYDIPVVSRVGADPFTSGKFFITSGHNQGGFVHMSEDYGITESMVFNSINMGDVRVFEANPSRKDEFWFMAMANPNNPEASCYKTIDGGIPGTWTKVNFGENVYGHFYDMAFHPEDPNTVYATGLYSIGIETITEIMKTTDGGKNWEIFGEFNGLPRMGNYITQLAVNPFDPEQVIAGSFEMPYITGDGGQTWNEYPIAIEGYEILELTGYSFSDLDYTGFENVIVGLGYNNDLLISNDNAKNWISLRNGESLSDDLSITGVRTRRLGGENPYLAIYISTYGGSMYSMEITEADLGWQTGNPTGIEKTWKETGKVYPNPTTGTVTLENVEGAEIRIYNETGRQISVMHADRDVIRIDALRDQSPGLYFIRILKDGSSREEKVLLIK